jgi:hypothetical protein
MSNSPSGWRLLLFLTLLPALLGERCAAEQTDADDAEPLHGLLQRAGWSTDSPLQANALDLVSVEASMRQLLPVSAPSGSDEWSWQVLPDGVLYKMYVAGLKESRFSTVFLHDNNRGWIWDSTMGGQVGILRYGSQGSRRPQGWQLDMDGAVMARLDVENKDDLDSADFRFGTLLTWANDPLAVRFGYSHISSHLGDEFLLRHPDYDRLNYVRDGLLLGVALHVTEDVRVYSEAGWAFSYDGGAKPWEFQFGSEYTPAPRCMYRPAPFAAINGHLRQELGFGGNVNVVAGWQWWGQQSDRQFRFGLQYTNGKSSQYSFFNRFEQLTGIGLWMDY